jgi:hypothetical protein
MKSGILFIVTAIALMATRPLFAADPSADAKALNKALFKAARNSDLGGASALIQQGADINAKGDNKQTALYPALGDPAMMRILLDKGADVNVKDYMGYTPLMRACTSIINNRLTTVHLLLEHGADVNLEDDDGWTPLMNACRDGLTDVVRALLEKGADTTISKTVREGRIENGVVVEETTYVASALTLAKKGGHSNIVKLLEKPAASPVGARSATAATWPSGSGYIQEPLHRPAEPYKISTTTTATLCKATGDTWELKGRMEYILDANTGESKPLVVYPGAELIVECKDQPVIEIKDYNGDPCRLPYGTTVKVDTFGQFVPLRFSPPPTPTPTPAHRARTSAVPRPRKTARVYTSACWQVECESAQFASVAKGSGSDITVTLRANRPSPVMALVFLCRATVNPPETFNEILEVPAVRLSEGGIPRYAGYRAEFLTRSPSVTPTWMLVEPKNGPRTLLLGPPLSGEAKLDLHQGDRVRITVAYTLPDPVVLPPDGSVEIRTSSGVVSQPFPPADASLSRNSALAGTARPAPESAPATAADEPSPGLPVQLEPAVPAPAEPTDKFGQVHRGDTSAVILEKLGRGGFIKLGKTEILVYPEGKIILEDGRVTDIERTPEGVNAPRKTNESGTRARQASPRSSLPRPPPAPESGFFRNARNLIPSYGNEGVLLGFSKICIENPNAFAVAVGLQNHNGGCGKFEVPANGSATKSLKSGDYDIRFVYENDPTSVYQGDSFSINDNQMMRIKLVTVRDGNYGIKKIK